VREVDHLIGTYVRDDPVVNGLQPLDHLGNPQ
jgi:hypothetical protein